MLLFSKAVCVYVTVFSPTDYIALAHLIISIIYLNS